MFDGLFGKGDGQRNLLEEVALDFFWGALRMMRDSLLLQFCRITDPAGSGTRTNLTTNAILEAIDWPADVRSKLVELNTRMMDFRKYVEPARSKRIAHADRRSELQQRTLGGFPPDADKQFLKDLEEFLSIANTHIPGAPVSLSLPVANGACQLVSALLKSRLYDACATCSVNERVSAFLGADSELG